MNQERPEVDVLRALCVELASALTRARHWSEAEMVRFADSEIYEEDLKDMDTALAHADEVGITRDGSERSGTFTGAPK